MTSIGLCNAQHLLRPIVLMNLSIGPTSSCKEVQKSSATSYCFASSKVATKRHQWHVIEIWLTTNRLIDTVSAAIQDSASCLAPARGAASAISIHLCRKGLSLIMHSDMGTLALSLIHSVLQIPGQQVIEAHTLPQTHKLEAHLVARLPLFPAKTRVKGCVAMQTTGAPLAHMLGARQATELCRKRLWSCHGCCYWHLSPLLCFVPLLSSHDG
jgi:hypothetical protein